MFLSAEAASPLIESTRAQNPDRQIGIAPHGSEWLIKALENRDDIDHVVANASRVVLEGGNVAAMSREGFIDLLKDGAVTDSIRRN